MKNLKQLMNSPQKDRCTYVTPLCMLLLLTELFSLDSTELWLLLTFGVENSLRIYWAWWKAIRHTPNKEKLKQGADQRNIRKWKLSASCLTLVYTFNYAELQRN